MCVCVWARRGGGPVPPPHPTPFLPVRGSLLTVCSDGALTGEQKQGWRCGVGKGRGGKGEKRRGKDHTRIEIVIGSGRERVKREGKEEREEREEREECGV